MQLTLTLEQAEFIQQELTIGHYANANDLVADALQLLANPHLMAARDLDANALTPLLSDRLPDSDRWTRE